MQNTSAGLRSFILAQKRKAVPNRLALLAADGRDDDFDELLLDDLEVTAALAVDGKSDVDVQGTAEQVPAAPSPSCSSPRLGLGPVG